MKKIIKVGLILAVVGVVVGGSIILYMFNMPHRDVHATKADYTITETALVSEYLKDNSAANAKYLSEDGESKILEITGVLSNISENFEGQKVILLKSDGAEAGVSATINPESNAKLELLKLGDQVTIKGVIRSGANYDEDLELYENVIIDKSDILGN